MPADKPIDQSSEIDRALRAIDELRDIQAVRRAELHRAMQEIHDLAIEHRKTPGDVRIPMPPIVPEPTGKWSWTAEDFIALWEIINRAAGQEICLQNGWTLEEFAAQVADMNELCGRIKGWMDEARLVSKRGSGEAEARTITLAGEWDAASQMVALSWIPPADPHTSEVRQSPVDPYDPLIEKVAAPSPLTSKVQIIPAFGPGVTMRFRVYSVLENGRIHTSNAVAVIRPLD